MQNNYFPPPLPSSPPPTPVYMSNLPSLYYPSSSSSSFSSSPPHPSSPYLPHLSTAPGLRADSFGYDKYTHQHHHGHPPPNLRLPPIGHRPQKEYRSDDVHMFRKQFGRENSCGYYENNNAISCNRPCSSTSGRIPLSSPNRCLAKSSRDYGLQKKCHLKTKSPRKKRITVVCDKLKGYTLNVDFASKYILGDELGSGGFGFVMSATSNDTQQEVAVKFTYRKKIPRHSWIHDPVHGPVPMELYVLLRVSQQPHPHIIRLVEFFADNEYFILVMELHGSPWSRTPKSKTQIPTSDRYPLANLQVSKVQNTSFSRTASPKSSFSSHPSHLYSSQTDEDSMMVEDELTDHDSMSSYHSSEDGIYNSDEDQLNDEVNSEESEGEEIRYAAKRESHDLFELIETRRNFTERQVRYMMRQLVDALWYLDSLSIYHRDIKDENILVDGSLNIKLIDFGSAVVLPSSSPTSLHSPNGPKVQFQKFYGTLQYAPVEVLKSQPYDAEKCDVWALGILLFTCLTGQTPFRTAEDAINKDWELKRNVSQECRDFLCKCLEKEPEKRSSIYQLARERWWLVDLP
ncbi:kinase-like domain-containing protein [Dipodascopsis uninucleata]